MNLVKANTLHVCKSCHENIYIGFMYYPQRRNKALCIECAKPHSREPKSDYGFIACLLSRLAK